MEVAAPGSGADLSAEQHRTDPIQVGPLEQFQKLGYPSEGSHSQLCPSIDSGYI